MQGIELSPSLSHCIETAAREEFWNLVNQYMEAGLDDEELEGKIELLKAFLESMDFRKLRSQSEKHLLKGKRVRFIIRSREGKPSYKMLVT
ncbi:MAG: hypothetical protein ACXQTH_02495 [Dehalococcoidia bacterium]